MAEKKEISPELAQATLEAIEAACRRYRCKIELSFQMNPHGVTKASLKWTVKAMGIKTARSEDLPAAVRSVLEWLAKLNDDQELLPAFDKFKTLENAQQ